MAAGVSVELDQLLVQFDDFVAVRDADVRIEPREFFSFLGPSDCGKTTILRTVSGFLRPTKGAVRSNGKDMTRIGPTHDVGPRGRHARGRVASAARGSLREGSEAILFIRPEALDIDAAGAEAEATIETTVMGEEFEGPNLHLQLAHRSGTELRASLVNKGTARTAQIGTTLRVVFDPIKAVALPAGALSEEE